MDKSAFKLQTLEEADDAVRNYIDYPVKERLEIAFYLTSITYRFDMENPPRMDKTAFCIRRHDDPFPEIQ